MNDIVMVILSLSISGSLLAMVLLVSKPLYKRRLRKSWQYYIWLIVLFRMIVPITPEANLIGWISTLDRASQLPEVHGTPYAFPEQNQTGEALTSWHENGAGSGTAPDSAMPNETLTEPLSETAPVKSVSVILPYLGLIWPITAVVLMMRKAVSYRRFIRFIHVGRKIPADETIASCLQDLCVDMGIERCLPVYVHRYIQTPMLIGVVKPCIVLPDVRFSESHYRMVLRHELTHYKQCDILYKWFVHIVVSLHWFNPLVYLMRKEIDRACELACDERILSTLDAANRHVYGDTLMVSVQSREKAEKTAAVFVAMSEDGHNLKERLTSIMSYSTSSIRKRIFSTVLAVVLITASVFTGAYTAAASGNALAMRHEETVSLAGIGSIDICSLYQNLSVSFTEAEEMTIRQVDYSDAKPFALKNDGKAILVESADKVYDGKKKTSDSPLFEIEIPISYRSDVKLGSVAGNITIPDGADWGNVNVNTVGGIITVKTLTVSGSLTLSSVSGAIKAETVKGIHVSIGGVSCSVAVDTVISTDYNISSMSGHITLGSIIGKGSVSSMSGTVTINGELQRSWPQDDVKDEVLPNVPTTPVPSAAPDRGSQSPAEDEESDDPHSTKGDSVTIEQSGLILLREEALSLDNINNVEIKSMYQSIIITLTDAEEISVRQYDSDKVKGFDFEYKDQSLSVWIPNVQVVEDTSGSQLEIEVPRSYKGHMSVDTVSGNIVLEDGVRWGDVIFHTTYGSIMKVSSAKGVQR